MKPSDKFDNTLGDSIVQLCQKQGVSRATLVRRSGLTFEEVTKIGRGWLGATLTMYRKVAAVLGVPLSEIFGECR